LRVKLQQDSEAKPLSQDVLLADISLLGRITAVNGERHNDQAQRRSPLLLLVTFREEAIMDYATTARLKRIKRRMMIDNADPDGFFRHLAIFSISMLIVLIVLMAIRSCTGNARACETVPSAQICTVAGPVDQARLDLESLLVDRETLLPAAKRYAETAEEDAMLKLFKFNEEVK
jgi:hypothetical protein